jgi:SAM-dependent methyltransferase
LQVGLPELDALRANRMPHRWVASVSAQPLNADETSGETGAIARDKTRDTATSPPDVPRVAIALHCDFDALPFDSQSLDLVVLPHALELARDPHLALREVERVLVPEGRVVIVGFNPASLWGLRQRLGRLRRRLASGAPQHLYLPSAGEFIGYRRLRDWLRLLSFEVEAGRFGCYKPPVETQKWLSRYEWTERFGERWWPVFGAVYFVVAVKRVRGMRLVGLVRDARVAPKAAAAPVVASRHRIEPTHKKD